MRKGTPPYPYRPSSVAGCCGGRTGKSASAGFAEDVKMPPRLAVGSFTMEGTRLIEQYDERVIRCPRVGGDVNFLYCRSENNMLPCGWIVGCWRNRVDINRFLEENYSDDELARIFALPRPRVESLLKMIDKAKERKKKE